MNDPDQHQLLKIKHQVTYLGLSYDNQLFAITKDENKLIVSQTLKNKSENGGGSMETLKFSYHRDFKNQRIKKMCLTGLSHMLLLTMDGAVYGYGNNEYGQLGDIKYSSNNGGGVINSQEISALQTQLTTFSHIGSIYSGVNFNYQWLPLQYFVRNNVKVADIKSGDDFTVFLDRDMQSVYVCGQSQQGQLLGLKQSHVRDPIKVNIEHIIMSGRLFISGTLQSVAFSSLFQIQTLNIELQQVFCYRNLLFGLDVAGQVYQFNELDKNLIRLTQLQGLKIKKLFFLSQQILYLKDSKGKMYSIDLYSQHQQPTLVNEKIQLYSSNNSYIALTYQTKSKKVGAETRNNKPSNSHSMIISRSNKNLNKSTSTQQKHITKTKPSANINSIKDQGASISSKKLEQIKNQSQFQILQQMLEQSQKENHSLMIQLQSLKEAKENDQKLMKMLCENLDQYQSGIPCNQCKLYEIEMKTLKQNLELQNERIDQLQKDSIIVNHLSLVRSSIDPSCQNQRDISKSPQDNNVFCDITNHSSNFNQFRSECHPLKNLVSSVSGYSPNNQTQSQFSQRYKNGNKFGQTRGSIEESKIRYASVHESNSVTDTFDDFLNKSAQKLRKIIKDCSTSQKNSVKKGETQYSPVKENIYTSPFDKRSYQDLKTSSIRGIQDKLGRLQESKLKLQEKLSRMNNFSSNRTNRNSYKDL